MQIQSMGLRRAAACVGVTAIAATAVASAGASGAGRGSGPLTFIVTNPKITFADPKIGPGDQEGSTFENVQAGRKIGTDLVSCTVVDTNQNEQCTVTVGLPSGTLELVYPTNISASHLTCPIVGGSGRYVGARGLLTLSPAKNGERAVVQLR